MKLVRQFYNTKNKKLYFLSSLPNPKPYHKLLSKFHDLIHPFDLISIFNIDEDNPESNIEESSDMNTNRVKNKRNSVDKMKFLIEV